MAALHSVCCGSVRKGRSGDPLFTAGWRRAKLCDLGKDVSTASTAVLFLND
jgi:hypothetical protein